MKGLQSGFSFNEIRADLGAGLTYALVNVPLCMGHALLAAVNPVFGIYTLMFAVPVAALWTSSIFMNVSTTSALAVATGAGLSGVGLHQRGEALVVLVLLVGIIQCGFGLFRLGFLVRFVSNSVMTGFLNGVAVLIILGQLGDLMGYSSEYSNKLVQAMDLVLHPGQIHLQTTVIGTVALGIIVVFFFTALRKFAFFIAITLTSGLLMLLGWDTVRVVGDVASIPRSLPPFVLPKVSLVFDLLLPALSIAIIGLIQGAGVSQSYPNPNGKYPDVSRDFLGQGVANIATSFFRGIPAGGSISGTAIIMSAGASSRWANILSGSFVAVIVLFATQLVTQVPMAALGALLTVAGVQALRVQQALTVWQASKVSAAVMLMTFLATLLFPLQYAILVGVGFSVLLHVVRQADKVVLMQMVPLAGGMLEEKPPPRDLPSHQLTILRIYGSLFFAAAKNLEEMLPSVDNTFRAVVILRLRGHQETGSTFVNVLRKYAQDLKARDSKLMLVGVDAEVHNQLRKTETTAVIGEENIFRATPRLREALTGAVAAAHAWLADRSGKNPDGR